MTTLGDLADLVEPDYRAELAELRSQIRYLADEWDGEPCYRLIYQDEVVKRLRALVGPWPHEVKS